MALSPQGAPAVVLFLSEKRCVGSASFGRRVPGMRGRRAGALGGREAVFEGGSAVGHGERALSPIPSI